MSKPQHPPHPENHQQFSIPAPRVSLTDFTQAPSACPLQWSSQISDPFSCWSYSRLPCLPQGPLHWPWLCWTPFHTSPPHTPHTGPFILAPVRNSPVITRPAHNGPSTLALSVQSQWAPLLSVCSEVQRARHRLGIGQIHVSLSGVLRICEYPENASYALRHPAFPQQAIPYCARHT